MMHPPKALPFLLALAMALPWACGRSSAALNVAGVFGDHMVLQRDVPLPVWGAADAGSRVIVRFASQEKSTTAGADGTWRVEFAPIAVSTRGQDLIATAGSETAVVRDVLVGDLWLCSGQSNMAFGMSGLKNTPYENDISKADHPWIRHGAVPRNPSIEPRRDTRVDWQVCKPDKVVNFTAAGYYFAREVQARTGVPVGLLHASWGGTSAESWTSREALSTVPDFKKRADDQIANLEGLPERIRTYPAAIAAWEKSNGREDVENLGEREGWSAPDAAPEGWTEASLPVAWKNVGLAHGGIVWIRKTIQVPDASAGKGFRLDLGLIDEQYVTAYWNGHKLGERGRTAPQFHYGYQNFDVPASLVLAGENTLALRFVSNTPGKTAGNREAAGWGFSAIGLKSIDNRCLVRIERPFAALDAKALSSLPPVPKGDAAHTSCALFGGMIHPLLPMPVKGCLWYQGEQDAGRAFAYRTLLPLMIRDWRSRWGRDFPFILQQLPNWKSSGATNTEWAELREAQALTARDLPGCHLSVGIDIGESGDVHPKNKPEIGRRLALVALEKVYGLPVASTGPRFASMVNEAGTIRVRFTHAEGLATPDGRPPAAFVIAGDDKRFEPAEAVIEGDSVILRSPRVPRPVAVRYAFVNDPPQPLLFNRDGLPAMPFRTDDWPCSTERRK